MLDVDGQIISPGELIARVEQLLSASHGHPTAPGPESTDTSGPLAHLASSATTIHSLSDDVRSLNAKREPHKPAGGRWLGKRSDRWEAQGAFDAEVATLAVQLTEGVARLEAEVGRLNRELEVLRRQNVGVRIQMAAAAQRHHELVREAPTRSEFGLLRHELANILQRLGIAAGSGAEVDYVGFEDRFRGKSADLRENQRRYLRFFPGASDPALILDFGCGRGEMVSLLAEAGHKVVGVDTDTDMVKACRAQGLSVVQDDGLHYLEGLDPDTLKGIFCAQVVEHMLTPELERFLGLAYDRLRPSGVLVVETINPRSLYAVGNHFWSDTTHVRPIHPETLRYIAEQIGFERVDMEETSLHPLARNPDGLADGDLGEAVAALLRNVFGYQDYVIVATK